MDKTNINKSSCPCVMVNCPRHGNCVECKKNHANNKTYCQKNTSGNNDLLNKKA